MNEPALLEAGDDLDIPAGLGLHSRLEDRRVACVAHGRGGHHANLPRPMQLHRPLKALERLERRRHRLRRDQPGLEDARSQPRHFAVFVEGFQAMGNDLGDLQSTGVGTDIDGGKGRHGCWRRSGKKNLALGPRYTTGPGGRGTGQRFSSALGSNANPLPMESPRKAGMSLLSSKDA